MPEFRSILSDIKKGRFAPVYILVGEEPYYIDVLTDVLEQSVVHEDDREFDSTVIYGADANAAMVMEAAGMFPMLAEKRLVMLKEAQTMQQAKNQLDKLAPYIAKPNPSAVLVVSFKGEKPGATSQLMKAVKKNTDVVFFESKKLKEYMVPDAIRDYCRDNNLRMEEKAIQMLVANVGSSLTNIFSEIEKLKVAQRETDKMISADMVADLIGVSKEFNNFELINAMLRRDFYQSVNIVRHFEENPKANPTVVVSATIFSTFQRLLLAAFSPDKSDKALMEVLNLKNPYGLRDIRTGLANYNATQLVNAIHAIRRFDTMSKGINSFQKEFPLLLELVCYIVTL